MCMVGLPLFLKKISVWRLFFDGRNVLDSEGT